MVGIFYLFIYFLSSFLLTWNTRLTLINSYLNPSIYLTYIFSTFFIIIILISNMIIIVSVVYMSRIFHSLLRSLSSPCTPFLASYAPFSLTNHSNTSLTLSATMPGRSHSSWRCWLRTYQTVWPLWGLVEFRIGDIILLHSHCFLLGTLTGKGNFKSNRVNEVKHNNFFFFFCGGGHIFNKLSSISSSDLFNPIHLLEVDKKKNRSAQSCILM